MRCSVQSVLDELAVMETWGEGEDCHFYRPVGTPGHQGLVITQPHHALYRTGQKPYTVDKERKLLRGRTCLSHSGVKGQSWAAKQAPDLSRA